MTYLQLRVLVTKINFIHLILFLLLLQSCNNSYTKSEYLTDYESFISDVKNNWSTYDNFNWEEKQEQNNKFYINYYNQFLPELKSSEIIKVKRLNFVFHFYNGDITVKKFISGEYNELFKGIAIEISDIVYELKLMANDVETEKKFIIINKLLE